MHASVDDVRNVDRIKKRHFMTHTKKKPCKSTLTRLQKCPRLEQCLSAVIQYGKGFHCFAYLVKVQLGYIKMRKLQISPYIKYLVSMYDFVCISRI